MSRKQFRVPSSTHEKKLSKKERRAQLEEQRAQQVPQEEVVPTEEDTAQIKNLALYSTIAILALLFLMYWIFING